LLQTDLPGVLTTGVGGEARSGEAANTAYRLLHCWTYHSYSSQIEVSGVRIW